MSLQDKENPSAPQIPLNNRFSFSKIPTFRKYSNNKKFEGISAFRKLLKIRLSRLTFAGKVATKFDILTLLKKDERILL
jgi:hypothetical protein